MRKTKYSESIVILIQILIAVLLFMTVVLRSWKAGFICSGDEIVYWERARFLLGQGGATWYSGNSLVSLGYSLLLIPICAVIKNPLYAYKAAVFMNGCFLCAGYIISVKAAYKMFSREKKSFLAVVCGLLVFCPIYAIARFYTGPEMILFFLIWLSLYCLLCLQEKYQKHTMILLTACMILACFFDISYLGVSAAILLILAIWVKKDKVAETTFLSVMFVLLVGLALGNIAERFVLASFCRGKDITYTSSLEVFLNGISSGWKNGYIPGLLRALSGKLYAVMAGSFLLICPALWNFAKRFIKHRKSDEIYGMQNGVILIALVQMVMIALYDNARAVQTWFISLDKLSFVLLPVILIGVVELKGITNWAAEMAGYLLLFCICTFFVADWFQRSGTDSLSRYHSGMLMLLRNKLTAASSVYVIACMVILAAVILYACVKERARWRKLNHMLPISAMMGLAVVFLVSDAVMYRKTASTDKKNDTVNSFAAASMLSGIPKEGKVYYIEGASGDFKMAKTQALVPEQEIEIIKSAEKTEFLLSEEWNDKNNILITRSEADILSQVEKDFAEFRILYLTASYAIWGHKNSEIGDLVEANVINRLETIPLSTLKITDTVSVDGDSAEKEESETETASSATKKQEYGSKIILAPGTYHLEVHFKLKEAAENEVCRLYVKDSNGEITDRPFTETIFDENGQGVIGMAFTNDSVMRDFRVVLERELLEKISVEAIYYRKTSSAYAAGLNEQNLNSVCDTILELDQSAGEKGSVAYVGDMVSDSSDLSMLAFESLLPDYDLAAVTKKDLLSLKSDYLVGETAPHAYLGAMQEYSVILREKTYTVLVRNDSPQAQAYMEQGNQFLSNETLLEISAVNTTNSGSGRLKLERGTYCYHANLYCRTDQLAGDENAAAGTLYLYNGETLVASMGLQNKDIIPDGMAEVAIPFTLRAKSIDLRCEIEMESAAWVTLEPTAIELVSEKYQYGSDDKTLSEFFALVNAMGSGVDLYVTQSEAYIEGGQYDFAYLEEMMPDAEIAALNYAEADDLIGDGLLLTRGYADGFMDLLNDYSLIGHVGLYTLWARNDGALLQRAVSAGAQVYNSGKKISPESIAAVMGYDLEEGLTLPAGKYAVTIELKAQQLDIEDTVEVSLLCDKTEKTIKKEVEALVEEGSTLRDAQKQVDLQEECGNVTVAATRFAGEDKVIVRVTVSNSAQLTNLVCEVYSWYGCDVEGEIVWIEKA